MRKVIFITVLFAIAGFVGMNCSIGSTAPREPENLRAYIGKYPSALLKGVPSVRTRLRGVLGANYNFFMARLQTEMPIEEVEGCLVGVGCMAHSCGSEDAVMVINLSDGRLHAAIRSDKFNGGYKVFSEDKQNIPHALYRMMEQY